MARPAEIKQFQAGADSVERLAIERGMAQGIEKDLEQGLERGMDMGLEKGLHKGQLNTLVRQLTRRFGPLPDATLARHQSATPDQLDLWTDRVLDAPALEAVLGGH
jgi:flagellar biosynthesis/type III secretory pathway protein FliH